MQVSVGDDFACAVTRDGRAFCWGDNTFGELGTPNAHANALPVQYLGRDFDNVKAISAGNAHACAIRSDASVWCWGSNSNGQLGNFNVGIGTNLSQPIQVTIHDPTNTPPNPPLQNVSKISAGHDHTCALLGDFTAACWGNNAEGELANSIHGGNFDSPAPVLVQGSSGLQALTLGGGVLVAGSSHTCGLVGDDPVNSVACWGFNKFGQLGIGSTVDEPVAYPAQDEKGKIKDAFSIALGQNFTCALLVDLTARCWGSNSEYQLGNPMIGLGGKQLTGVQVVAGDGTTLDNIVQLVAGALHACALRASNEIYCWGNNHYQQLGAYFGEHTNVPQKISIDAPLFTDNFDGN